jgi:hypothetical protein
LNAIGEIKFWIAGEYSKTRVIFFLINRDRKADLDGSDGIVLRDLGHIYLKINKSLVSTREQVFDIFGAFHVLFERGDCAIYLVFVNLDELNGLLFLLDL